MSAARPFPASLQAPTPTQTPYGGLDEAWAEVATLWVSVTFGVPAQQLDGAVSSPADADVATAVCRDHPAVAAGLRLLIGDDPSPWRVRRVDRGVPSAGRLTLRLDRLA